MSDTEISCTACGNVFLFTEQEKEFYEQKGFQPPRKCKACRDAAKQGRGSGYDGRSGGGGGYGGGGGGGGYDRPQRQLYDAICASCGVSTQVPFQPNGTKPVYCRDCFRSTASY